MEQIIIDYINRISKGVVTLKRSHVQTIIEIVKNQTFTGFVHCYKYNAVKEGYELNRTLVLEIPYMMEQCKKAALCKPQKGFYKYDCFNEIGTNIYTFYSLNPNLF